MFVIASMKDYFFVSLTKTQCNLQKELMKNPHIELKDTIVCLKLANLEKQSLSKRRLLLLDCTSALFELKDRNKLSNITAQILTLLLFLLVILFSSFISNTVFLRLSG